MSCRRELGWLFAIVVLLLVLSAGRYKNGFVYDDVQVIEKGTLIHDSANLPTVFGAHTMVASSSESASTASVDTFRPLTLVTFFWDSMISGKDPLAYHITSSLLHVLCVFAFWWFVRRYLRSAGLALALSATFAFQPIFAEAYIWINGRSDPVALLFFLLAVAIFRLDEKVMTWRSLVVAPVLFLASMLSKEVVLPLILVLPFLSVRASVKEKLLQTTPMLVAAGVYLGWRTSVLKGLAASGEPGQLTSAVLHLPHLMLDGALHLSLPLPYVLRSLRDDYALTTAAHISIVILFVVLSAALLWLVRRSERSGVAFAGLLWFAASLAPVAMISTMLWPGFGRYLYIPAAGFLLSVGVLLERSLESVRVARGLKLAFGVWILAAAFFLVDAVAVFQSNTTLYLRSAELRPTQAFGHGFLGIDQRQRGNMEKAVASLSIANRIDPKEYKYQTHLGWSLVTLHRMPEATAVAERAIEQFRGQPYASTFHLMAINAMQRRDPNRAVFHALSCLKVMPSRKDCQRAMSFFVAQDRVAHCQAAEEMAAKNEKLRALVTQYCE